MQYAHHIAGWEDFDEVKQDAEGLVATTGGGLYTRNLMNCMGLILSNGQGRVGMLHVNPSHAQTLAWIQSLRAAVGATHAVVTGANSATQAVTRTNQLVQALNGLTVIDETKDGWVAQAMPAATRGQNRMMAGYAAVKSGTEDYAISLMPFPATVNHTPPPATTQRRGRKCGDGGCVIL